MDQSTHEVRLSHWRTIIEQCQQRPKGQTINAWLRERDISDKQYYYWQRLLRREAYNQMKAAAAIQPPAIQKTDFSEEKPARLPMKNEGVTFLELPVQPSGSSNEAEDHPDVVIRTGNASVSLYNSVSDRLLSRVLEVIGHAG